MAPYAQDCCSGKDLATYVRRRVHRSRRLQSREPLLTSMRAARAPRCPPAERKVPGPGCTAQPRAAGELFACARIVSPFSVVALRRRLQLSCDRCARVKVAYFLASINTRIQIDEANARSRQRCASSASSTTFALASQLLPLRADAPRAAGAATASTAAAPHAAELHCCMIMCTSRVY